MDAHEYKNSKPGQGYDNDCAICGGKDRDSIHNYTPEGHTAGPWYTRAKPTDRQGVVCSARNGASIAVTYDPKDALIVAAAPKMHAALKKLLARCEEPDSGLIRDTTEDGLDNCDAMADARAALAAVRGD